MNGYTTIAYDCELYRPACPILQAALGGDVAMASRFDADYWLIEPTPGLKLYPITERQLQVLLAVTKAKAEVSHPLCLNRN